MSEYNSNYRSPEKFEYKEGAWRGANPPHVESAKVRLLSKSFEGLSQDFINASHVCSHIMYRC